MNLTFSTKSNCKPPSCRGFALVTALSIMAFMLVLVVTLLSLIEVETRSAGNNLELQRAREGARLALNMAIGKLQEYASDDKRVTARAEVLGETRGDGGSVNNFDSEARYWTGVWDTTNASADPKWLVSWHDEGSEPDPDDVPADNLLMQLVGEGSVGDDTDYHVFAPYTNIYDKNGNVSSRIAWWVSDEGVKASAALLPLNKRPSGNPGFTPPASRNALYTALTTTYGLETIFANYSRFDADDAPQIDRVTSVSQLISQEGFPQNSDPNDTGWNFEHQDQNGSTVAEAAFHTLTSVSYGLLASTEPDIGLMEDLSLFANEISDELEHYLDRGFNSAIAKSAETSGSVAAMRQSVSIRGLELTGALADGDIASLSTPILTNFMIAFAVYEDTLEPRLRMHFFSEFWNPYTSTLRMNDGGVNYELELRITGLPTVTLNASPSMEESEEIDLQSKLQGSGGEPFAIRLKYPRDEDGNEIEEWHPGMTKNWTGISDASSHPYESSETKLKEWESEANTLGGNSGLPIDGVTNISNEGDTLTVNGINASDEISVDVYLVGPDTEDDALLTQISAIQYNQVNATIDPSESSRATFGYHFILRGPHQGNADLTFGRGLWLSNNDPRNPSNSVYVPTHDGLEGLVAPVDPHGLEIDNEELIERPLRLFNRSDDSGDNHYRLWQESPLFELPRERVLSLASLQHLYFHNERPFKVGNSWGDDTGKDTLRWFDRYFLSGLNKSDSLNSFTQYEGFPNPILTTYEYQRDPDIFDDDPKSIARNALVAGRFNLNSTSVTAWKALLGGLRINSWPYLDYYSGNVNFDTRISNNPPEIEVDDKVSRGNMFTRFPGTLQETYDVFLTPDLAAPSEFYRRGVRYLTSGQIEDMAVSIVNQIKTRVQSGGTPFFTLKDFLNNPDANTGSVLEEAIQASVFTNNVSGRQQWDRSWETDSTVNDDSDRIDIDHFSPGFLTQADIMAAIGPMLAPRSDTFKIRARCQTLSPFDPDDIIGDAIIEAMVQRVPDPVDSKDDIDDSIQRKFKVISMRWLTEDEL